MSAMRTFGPGEARDAAMEAVVAHLSDTSTPPSIRGEVDAILAALGIDGPVTVVPGRLDEAVAVLTCPWSHVLLWPEHVTPYPDDCPAKIASTSEGPRYCGKALTQRGVLLPRLPPHPEPGQP